MIFKMIFKKFEFEFMIQRSYNIDKFCDIGMKLMVQHLVDNLEFFKEEEHWKEEHYVWCHDFLSDPD